ncbi:MAG: arsinothricin resistance N-acetyltransferase ArsN1 [Chloroflexota bacterium]
MHTEVVSPATGHIVPGACMQYEMRPYPKPETETVVRHAHSRDAAAIADLYNQGIVERSATFETALRQPDDIVIVLLERGTSYPTLVAERDGRVVACAWAGPYRSRDCYAGVAEFSVYTAQAARGTGAGRVVLSSLVIECEKRGFWKLVSRVFPENVASRALCRRVGFREVGTYYRHAKVEGAWRDCIIVEKLLGEAALP